MASEWSYKNQNSRNSSYSSKNDGKVGWNPGGKLDFVQVSGEFKLSEFESLGFYCILCIDFSFWFTCFSCVLSISRWKSNVWICLLIISHSAMQLSTEIYNS